MAIQLTDIAPAPQGGTGRKYIDLFVLDRSMTWSPDKDCKAVITVIGGGGGGGIAHGFNSSSGGSAGGLAQSNIITLNSATSYTVTVGLGGVSNDVTSVSIDGTAGGASSFTDGASLNLQANGGGAGRGGVPAFAGGTASGGAINYQGGLGGHSSTTQAAGGGGAVNITGTGYSGVGNYQSSVVAHGGAGCGGPPITRYTGPAHSFNSGGPGTLTSVIDFYYLIPSYYGGPATGVGYYSVGSGSSPYYGSAAPLPTPPMFVGGASSGSISGNPESGVLGQQGGMFAGGGATLGDNSCKAQAGDGGLFGGGGGAVSNYAHGMECRPSKGGDGVVFVAVTEYL